MGGEYGKRLINCMCSFCFCPWISSVVKRITLNSNEETFMWGILNYFSVPLWVSVWWQSQIQEYYQWGRCRYHASPANWSRQRWPHVLVPVGSRSQCQNVHRRTRWSRWLIVEMHCQVSFIGILLHLFVFSLLWYLLSLYKSLSHP